MIFFIYYVSASFYFCQVLLFETHTRDTNSEHKLGTLTRHTNSEHKLGTQTRHTNSAHKLGTQTRTHEYKTLLIEHHVKRRLVFHLNLFLSRKPFQQKQNIHFFISIFYSFLNPNPLTRPRGKGRPAPPHTTPPRPKLYYIVNVAPPHDALILLH
jgi:hypothetical protein